MSHVFVPAIALLIVLGVLAVVAKLRTALANTTNRDLYYLRPTIVTAAERSFLGVLQSLNYENVSVLTKIRIADVIGVRKGLDRGERQSALNRIVAKHVDFLLVRTNDFAPILGIELDDQSHDAPARMARDELVDYVFKSVGLPLLHVRAQASYDPKAVYSSIDEALSQKG